MKTVAENLQSAYEFHAVAEVARNRAVAQRKAGNKDAAEQSARECFEASSEVERAYYRIVNGAASAPDAERKNEALQDVFSLRRQCAAFVAQADDRGYY